MDKELFITDFDGTLLRDDKLIDPMDIEALELLGEMGIFRAVATGRSIYSFKTIMDKLGFSGAGNPLPVDFVILSTGAEIMTFPCLELLKSHCLEPEEVNDIVGCFEKNSLDYMIHRAYPKTNYFVYNSHGSINPDFFNRIKLYKSFCTPLNRDLENGFGYANQVLAIVPSDNALGIAEKIEKKLPAYSVIKATSPLDGRSLWIEVFPLSVSKGSAASWLAQKLGVERSFVVSVGNDYNDMDLLLWSGKGFVVGNAPLELRRQFETVMSNNQCGVAEVIYKHFGISNEKK